MADRDQLRAQYRAAKARARRLAARLGLVERDEVIALPDGINLWIDSLDHGGRFYAEARSYEEISSPLYAEIHRALQPRWVVDVGANYGFTAIIFARAFPDARLILVEPSKSLLRYIERNLASNQVDAELVPAVCSDVDGARIDFSLHPTSSQDNRVQAPSSSWRRQPAESVTLTTLLSEATDSEGIFIKVDTQGYEQRVFDGAHELLGGHRRWLIKTELAPHWLRSQGTDPAAFVAQLLARYECAEAPNRLRFKGDGLDAIFDTALRPGEERAFVHYVENQAPGRLGWCDLFVRPRSDAALGERGEAPGHQDDGSKAGEHR